MTADEIPGFSPVPAGTPKLCTTFSDFKKFFGDFSGNLGHDRLAQAVYGFFNNGGSRCYVMRVKAEADVSKFLVNFEAIDEIAIVAAPGLAQNDTDGKNTRTQIIAHCVVRTRNRFAIFDSPEVVESGNPAALDLGQLDPKASNTVMPPVSDCAAFYFPWLQAVDPISNAVVNVPPSGHIAMRASTSPVAFTRRRPMSPRWEQSVSNTTSAGRNRMGSIPKASIVSATSTGTSRYGAHARWVAMPMPT